MGAFDDLIPAGSTGGDAKSKLTRNELGTQETQQNRIPQLRGLLGMVMQAETFNRRLPTGRFNANVNELGQQFPTSWQGTDAIANYQAFAGLRQKMMKPAMSLLSGDRVAAGENNAASERMQNLQAIPGPQNEREANVFLNEDIGKRAQLEMARLTLADKWRKQYGTSHALNEKGETLDGYFNRYMTTGAGAKWRDKPMGAYLDEANARAKAKIKAPVGGGGWSAVREK